MLSHSVRKPFGDRLELAVCFLLLDEAGETWLEIPSPRKKPNVVLQKAAGLSPNPQLLCGSRRWFQQRWGGFPFSPLLPFFPLSVPFFPSSPFPPFSSPLFFPPSFPLPVSFRPTAALGAQSRTARRPRCTHGVRRGSGGREKRMKKLREKGEISDLCCARGWREREARKKEPL